MPRNYLFSSIILVLILVFPSSILAQDSVIHFESAGETQKKVGIAIPEFVLEENSKDPSGLGIEMREALENELKFSEQFKFVLVEPAVNKETALQESTRSTLDFKGWSQMGAQWLLKINYYLNPQDETFSITFKLYETATERLLMGKGYTATEKKFPEIIQQFLDEIVLLSEILSPVSGGKGPMLWLNTRE